VRLFADVYSTVQDPFLRRALVLAEKGRGTTAPNPLVGCVMVRDGRIVGEGFHAYAGGPHAEVCALSDARDAARGAVAYVTMEPCSHYGRTPPCTAALIEAGVSEVVAGMADPTRDAGGGAQQLREAGIVFSFAQNPEPFEVLNRGWLHRVTTGRPFVTVKVGTSIDGKIALAPGSRSSMTGPHGTVVTSELRRRSDAVVVGGSTAACDDPRLTVRDAEGAAATIQPTRVVLAGGAMPLQTCALFTDGSAPTLVLAAAGTDVDVPGLIDVIRYPGEEGLLGALRVLGDAGFNDVLIEPGAKLFASLWNEDLIDSLVTVTGGGIAGSCAQSLYPRAYDSEVAALSRRMQAVDASIVGDVSVTVWGRSSS
jgi:diaminohydroxyphosphoribosylaminopyrimidine deaminase / 5-amino-6-(5-phosphoribosylamino)uracil reductase